MEKGYITVYCDIFHDFNVRIVGYKKDRKTNKKDREADDDWYRSLPKEKRYRILRLLEYRYKKYGVMYVFVKYFKCLNNMMEEIINKNRRDILITKFKHSDNAALRIFANQLKLVKY